MGHPKSKHDQNVNTKVFFFCLGLDLLVLKMQFKGSKTGSSSRCIGWVLTTNRLLQCISEVAANIIMSWRWSRDFIGSHSLNVLEKLAQIQMLYFLQNRVLQIIVANSQFLRNSQIQSERIHLGVWQRVSWPKNLLATMCSTRWSIVGLSFFELCNAFQFIIL